MRRASCPASACPPDDVAEARALVLLHLAMYHVATRRDLDDPATIEEFCRPIRGREALRDLYLLTVADLTTTSPTAMTSWKARMLEELYLAADDHLRARATTRPRRAGGARPRGRGGAVVAGRSRGARGVPDVHALPLPGLERRAERGRAREGRGRARSEAGLRARSSRRDSASSRSCASSPRISRGSWRTSRPPSRRRGSRSSGRRFTRAPCRAEKARRSISSG